jgi:uncharacterized tellurite resistance protein B-like protein
MNSSEAWTTSHDLALIYIALAYGTDHELTEGEMDALTDALREWAVVPNDAHIQEIVMEAATAFLEGDTRAEVRRSIDHLADELTRRERRHALQDVMRVAEADGVLLESEQGLIHILADAWSLKELGEDLLADSSAAVQERGENWGLIHELSFLYIVVAHSSDEELSTDEIDVILERLQEWQPTLTGDEVRDVFRRALQVYADDPETALIRGSVEALKEALPMVQRLTALDDLNTVAHADGPPTANERELIKNLAQAWDIKVRLNGRS